MDNKLLLCASIFLVLQGCGDNSELKAPEGTPQVKATPLNWQSHQQEKVAAKNNYINQHQAAFDWFADFAFSETDGTPYLLLKLLPKVAPDIWGSEENFLDVVGLFKDSRQKNYPVARGIGLSAFAREKPFERIDYASFTCAACHIGRVKLEDGSFNYLDGGVNTEFNIILYRVKLFQTLQKIYNKESNEDKRKQLLINAFMDALDKTHEADANYFYNNYSYANKQFNAEYEKKQIALFKLKAEEHITHFAQRITENYNGYAALLDKNYSGFQQEMLAGFGGMADATGISTVNGYIAAKQYPVIGWFASLVLPPSPGITDFMSVWEQDKRKASWNKNHDQLINGGGQWNGNIPIPMYRNLAAQKTLGLENNDIRVSAFGVDLLDGLPASVYPFNVDTALAKKGEKLFAQNCAACHQPHNGKVYDELGTNLDRSFVVGKLIAYAARSGFSDTCNPSTTLDMGGEKIKPCAEFDGVSLKGKKSIIMSPTDQHHGYNARPLSGIWAQAPYLHNGSVPTLYHLLIPEERPETYIKGRLDYDQEKVGYAWKEKSTSNNVSEYIFDTNAFPAFSNKGHDKNIATKDHSYKLNWSDDKQGAEAIIEYMKTL